MSSLPFITGPEAETASFDDYDDYNQSDFDDTHLQDLAKEQKWEEEDGPILKKLRKYEYLKHKDVNRLLIMYQIATKNRIDYRLVEVGKRNKILGSC